MARFVKLMGRDGGDGLLIPIAHIQGVETRALDNLGGPYIMVGGHKIGVTKDVALETVAFVQSYWAVLDGGDTACIDATRKPLVRSDPADRLPDGLGERGA